MGPVVRSVLGVIAGIVLAMVLVMALEMVSHLIYPPPPGLDPTDLEAMRAAMGNVPSGALWLVLVGWAVATVGGGCLAAWIAGRSQTLHAMIVGGVMMAAGILNMAMLPHPPWFWVVGVAVFLPAARVGARLSPGARAA